MAHNNSRYPAKSEVPRPRFTQEEGDTGIKGGMPYGNIVMEEFLPALVGQAGLKHYREMAENDTIIGAILFAIEMLIRQVKWRVEPFDDSSASKKAADFMANELFHEMEIPLGDVIEEALSMLTYGFAPFEIVLARREQGALGVRKIAIRSQETIAEWKWTEHGDVIGLEQWSQHGDNIIIPMSKILNFRTTSRRGNPEGRSILRNAYVTYVRKNVIEEAEGRLALRSAGVATLRIPGRFMQADADSTERQVYDAYKIVAKALAQDRQGSLVLPSDRDEKGNLAYEFEYVTADSRKTSELGGIVTRQEKGIATTVLADFILLGQDKVGSFALASSKTSLFARAVGAFRDVIADRLNELIHRVWIINAFPPETMPKAVPGDLEAPDLDALGNFLTKLAGSGMMMFPSKNGSLEAAVLEAANLPNPTQEVA